MPVKNVSSQVKVLGVEYSSLAEACRSLNVPRSRINSRLRRGMSLDEAFSTENRGLSKNIA